MAQSGRNLLIQYVRTIYASNSHGAEQFTLYMILATLCHLVAFIHIMPAGLCHGLNHHGINQ